MKRFLRSSIGSVVATVAWRNRHSIIRKVKEVFGSDNGAPATAPQRSHT